ncbi:hypothetical protein ACIGBL_15365 [Streptomyces sp. NPDC085614]|uniref:hypothetical protein n=1 Tax=Streptomyces sp. NPDC085614 TaxID=3365733 RepID=UPI0037D6CFAE
MNRGPTRLRLLAALPFPLVLAAHTTLFVRWGDRLPDPLATHFSAGGGGRADGWTGATAYALIASGLLVALGAGWTLLVRRGALWGAWATAGFTGALLLLVLGDNLDAVDAATVTSPPAHLLVAGAAAGVAGLLGLALTRLVPPEPAVPPGPGAVQALPLGATEVAGWSRGAGSRAMASVGAVTGTAGLALFVAGPWPVALVLLVSGLLVLLLAGVRVSVDRRGLTVRPTLAPWPRIRVPLDRVEGASVRDVDPLADFGGWGYRVRAHTTGVVLRSGEALVVRKDGGQEFAVTVPDAATAAALLTALVERRGHGKV